MLYNMSNSAEMLDENEEIEIELDNEDLSEGSSSSGSEATKKDKKTRRARSDMIGRDYICMFCKRAYLSVGSLVYHCRLKHAAEPGFRMFVASHLKGTTQKKLLLAKNMKPAEKPAAVVRK